VTTPRVIFGEGMSHRKGRNFSQALQLTQKLRRLYGIDREMKDPWLARNYFKTIVDLTSPPASRYPLITSHEAAFLISELYESRVASLDSQVMQICILASELELPVSVVDGYWQKWEKMISLIYPTNE
jgi:hypothetical protein